MRRCCAHILHAKPTPGGDRAAYFAWMLGDAEPACRVHQDADAGAERSRRMSIATPFPDFFGRLTTVRSQHEHLGVTLRNLDSTCDALEIGRTSLPVELTPQVLLTALRDDLGQ